MDYETLSYRFLELDELDIFLDLHDASDVWMGQKKNPCTINMYRETRKKLFIDSNNKTAGAFDANNRLVAATAGWYPKDFPYWYTHGQVHNLSNNSLSNGIDSWMVLMKMLNLLCQYAESKKYFSFYNYRSLKHQLSIEKIKKIVDNKGLFYHRYNSYWEYIYTPGDTTIYRNHKFYSPTVLNSSSQDNVVVLYTLKQEHRLPMLSQNKYQHEQNQI